MAKSCSQCGTENSDSAKFCRQCAAPIRDSASRCSSGHIIAPGQSKCPICEAEKQNRSTLVEEPASGPGDSPFSLPLPSPGVSGRSGTQVMPGGQAAQGPDARARGGRGSTMVLGVPAQGALGVEPALDRKIVGVLITYSTRPDGVIFPVREGRNRIGRNPENEISVPGDTAMSGLNSYIIFHPQGRKQFVIDDANSQNGTYVDGEIVEERTRLNNYAEVRAGSTVFTFIAAWAAPRYGTEELVKEGAYGTDLSNL